MPNKLPIYPDDFFDFTGGMEITNDKINEDIESMVKELNESNGELRGLAKSTGNTKIDITQDLDTGEFYIEVYKNYQRKSYTP